MRTEQLTDRAIDDADDLAERLTRAGWLAKGLVFVVIGVLALELARRRPDEDADQTGALAAIADVPAGRALVLATGVGIGLFAIWQLWAALRRSHDDLLGLLKRFGWAGLGLVYGMLAVTATQIALDGGTRRTDDGDSVTSPSGISGVLLDLPFGRWLVAGIGFGTVTVALYHLRKAAQRDFLDDIDTDDLEPAVRRALAVLGTAGFVARAALLGLAGYLFVAAARQYDPDRAAGIDQSLRTLVDAPYGRPLLAACALGIIAAGIYDMVTFRRQRLTDE